MGAVVEWFEARGEIPLRQPFRVREYAPVTDDSERPVDEYFLDTIRGVAFAIEYCDPHGWMSTRTIRCLGIDTHHPACISAFCHARGSVMSFRVDRIISIIGLNTGEVVSSDEHLALLSPYLADPEPGSDLSALVALQAATRDGVFALLDVAMAEGNLGEEARALVLDYVRAEADAVGLAMPPTEFVDVWVNNLAPPLESVTRAIRTLLVNRDKFARVLPRLLKVARCPGALDVSEDELRDLFAAVRKHFRRAPRDFPSSIRATR